MENKLKKLTYYQLRFLFDAYKAGAFLTTIHTYSPQAKKAIHFLKGKGYLNLNEIHSKQFDGPGGIMFEGKVSYLLVLTELGIETVKREFFNFLQNAKLHLKHTLIAPGDQIRIHKTVKNGISPGTDGQTRKYVRAPHDTLEMGLYTVASVDMRSLLLLTENGQKYRINSYHCKEVATLDTSKLHDLDYEITKRFGRIHVKKLTEMLIKECQDNFKVTKIINQVQKSTVAKGRFGGNNG